MDKRKVILLFSDLEGTILKEENGQYDDDQMYAFLEQIDKLQTLTDADVNMHLVSPVYPQHMEKIMDQIDKNIHSYNRIHETHKNISEIECGASYPEDMISEEFLGDRIMPLKKPISRNDYDIARYGKYNYVRTWYDIYTSDDRKNLVMCIYCGNGANDVAAMDFINSTKKGFVVCPKNTRTEAKEKAYFVSEKRELPGITEGLGQICKRLEKSTPEEKEEKKGEEQR